MKKIILLELALLFLATTFQSDNPPGWYQQTLPVNDNINDIFFLDSLNGWAVTYGRINPPDTAYIMKTTNGGDNWNVQFSNVNDFLAIQFTDENTGYACGGFGIGTLFKSTNGGTNWSNITFGSTNRFTDLDFINQDTGWICSDDTFDGGLFKTTNGGVTWQRQLNETYKPEVVFFLNKDTGWVSSNVSTDRLFRTTNGGQNWSMQYGFNNINDIVFLDGSNGYVSSGINYRTTNGGFNWIPSETNVGGIKLSFGSDSVGWGGVNFNKISKTTNKGISWYYQSSPIFDNTSVSASDNLKAWAGGFGIVHTTNGGDTLTGINQTGNFIPSDFSLYQNYPNPFNPNTKINYELRVTGYVKLSVFDITGKVVKQLVNKKQSPGNYNIEFNGEGLTSGIYFYRIEITDEKSNEIYVDTKKMILTK